MCLNCGVGGDSWESLGQQGDQTSQSSRKSILNIHWKDWCWSWSSNTLATWCEELTHWKRPWCWEGLGAGGEGDDRGWDGWMASLTRWTWVWASSGRWWWTGRPGVLQSVRSRKVRHDWATEMNSEHNTLQAQGLALAMLLCPRDLPGKSTGVGFAMPVSRGPFWPRNETWISYTPGRLFTVYAPREC